MTRQLLFVIVNTLILVPYAAKAEEPTLKKVAQPKSNQVYVKIIMPSDPADHGQDRPDVEFWIAKKLEKFGQARFTAVTGWVPMDRSLFAANIVWDGNLGDNSYCPVAADIPDPTEGRIKVILSGWSPGGAFVTVSMKDEPGGRAVAAVEELRSEQGMPYVAVLIGPPLEKSAPSGRKKSLPYTGDGPNHRVNQSGESGGN